MDTPVFYRVKDPIQNFHVRVNIKCVQTGNFFGKNRHKETFGGPIDPALDDDLQDNNSDQESSDEEEGDERLEQASDKSESDFSDNTENDHANKRKKKKNSKARNKNKTKDTSKDKLSRQRKWTASFTWQEKRFGPREILKYIDTDSSVGLGRTAIEAEYKEEVSRRLRYGEDLLRDIGQVTLFTYTDKDGFVPKNELTKFVTTSEEFVINPVAESIVTIPESGGPNSQSSGSALSFDMKDDPNNGVYGEDDGDYASLNNKKRGAWQSEVSAGQRLFRESPFKVFYLMAAVDVDTGSIQSIRESVSKETTTTRRNGDMTNLLQQQNKEKWPKKFYEVVLCTVKVNREGSLVEMQPGFSKSQYLDSRKRDPMTPEHQSGEAVTWYRFTTPHGCVYEYSLTNEAQSNDPLLETEINTIQREATEMALATMEGRINNLMFGGPSLPQMTVFSVYVEIVSAFDFVDAATDQLYVQYEVVLPQNGCWSWISSSNSMHEYSGKAEKDANYPLRGVTQTTRSRYMLAGTVEELFQVKHGAESGNCGEVKRRLTSHYCFPIEFQAQRKAVGFEQEREMPKVYFQIKSRDSWDRHRVEGYAHLVLPLQPGSREHVLKSWKVGGTLRQQCAEFFIGGALQLNSLRYTAFPQSHSGPFLNRYGFTSETSGSLRVRTHLVEHAHVPSRLTEKLDTQAKERRQNGINDTNSVLGAELGHVAAQRGNTQTRRRTVSDILTSLRFGRKLVSTGSNQTNATQGNGADLLASLNRLRSEEK